MNSSENSNTTLSIESFEEYINLMNEKQCFCLVDDREPLQMRQFLENNYGWKQKRLGVGDYAMFRGTLESPLIIWERKTWEDLASSLNDGRAHEQRAQLNNITGDVMKVIIIEGKHKKHYKTGWKGRKQIPRKQLEVFLQHTQFRNDIRVIYSEDKDHTLELLIALNMFLLKQENQHIDNHISNYRSLSKKNLVNTNNLLKLTFCQIPGISKTVGTELVDKMGWESVRDFCYELENDYPTVRQEMSDVVVGKRRIGNKKVDKILKLFGF